MGSAARPDLERLVRDRVAASAATVEALLAGSHAHDITTVAAVVTEALRAGGKVLLFGNGGSAAHAQHIAAELVGRFERERAALPAVALPEATASGTAIANDFGFEAVFARQVHALGRPGDVAVAISTSGESDNVVAGVLAAREAGLRTVGLTGANGGRLEPLVDFCLRAPAQATPRIQEVHSLVGHIVCELVEQELFGDAPIVRRGHARSGDSDGHGRPSWPSAVFVDRDGTINRKPPEGEYVTAWHGFDFLPGAKEGLRLLTELGVPLIVVTNQRGIALGRMTEADVHAIHRQMESQLEAAGVTLSGVYVCPHDDGDCGCRKPEPGMLRAAQRDVGGIRLAQSVLIGDSGSDMEAAARAGVGRIRIGRAPGPVPGIARPVDRSAASLWEAALWIWRTATAPAGYASSSIVRTEPSGRSPASSSTPSS
jgi:D-sedoheptulose 7-phosphate isomerase